MQDADFDLLPTLKPSIKSTNNYSKAVVFIVSKLPSLK
jgi:hypothetical protein